MRHLFRPLVLAAATAALAGPAPAQDAHASAPVLRALALDAGLLRSASAPVTAAFGATLDLAPPRLPGLLRAGVSSWIADRADGNAVRGRDLSLLWLLRSAPAGGAGWRIFAGAGPALAALDDGGGTPALRTRAAAATQAGLELPLAPREAVALELRFGALKPVHRPAQLSLRLGLLLTPSALHGLASGEPASPSVAVSAQPAPGPSDLAQVLAAAGGVLTPVRAGGGLRLAEVAFDTGGTDLTRQAARQLAAAGGTLRRLGAGPLHVVIYTDSAAGVDAHRASLRAVSVARALFRGGYPPGRIFLEDAAPRPGEDGAGEIVGGGRCINDCVVPATLPPR